MKIKGNPWEIEEVRDNTPTIQAWVAKVVSGAMVADGNVGEEELVFLQKLVDGAKGNPVAENAIRLVITTKVAPYIEPLHVSKEVAELIYKHILKICASDEELHPGELQYIVKVSEALSIPAERMKKLLHQTFNQVNVAFFQSLLQELENEGKVWLALVVLKMIYADERLDKNEIIFLSHVNDLLEHNPSMLHAVKQNPKNFELEDLPQIKFTPPIALKVMKYLLNIVMVDDSIDPREFNMLIEIAARISFPVPELKKLVESRKTEIQMRAKIR